MSTCEPWDREGVEHDPESLAAVDRYVDTLAQSSHSDDGLGQLFIQARQESERDIPRSPRLEDIGFFHSESVSTVHDCGAWKNQRDRTQPDTSGDGGVSQGRRMRRRSWRHGDDHSPVPRWAYVLGGAAASCVLLAGSGVVIHASSPGSPLWGLNQRFFGDHAAAVELASTLDQLHDKQAAGDTEAAAELLEKARDVAHKSTKELGPKHAKKHDSTTVTVPDQSVVKGPKGDPSSADTADDAVNNDEVGTHKADKDPAVADGHTSGESTTVTVTVTSTVTPTSEPTSGGKSSDTTPTTPSSHEPSRNTAGSPSSIKAETLSPAR
ncbi:hypothetical protein ACGE24_05250 [Corynebacterium kroppenstedtii]|uniref:hypothetical protein n=1 Tax=Corynebacterium sp. PCR 32 TaxID=3351342 RepID=UPI0030A29AFF